MIFNFRSLLASTVGRLAGNKAYYDTKKRHAMESAGISQEKFNSVVTQCSQEYLEYQQLGGFLGLEGWIEERAHVATLSKQELTVRFIRASFLARDITDYEDKWAFIRAMVNSPDVSRIVDAFKATDSLSDETLLSLSREFSAQLIRENGMGEEKALSVAFSNLCISPDRLNRLGRNLGLLS